MGAVFALISKTSAISFDINYNTDGVAHFVNQWEERGPEIAETVVSDVYDIEEVVSAF